ncbi:M23 family metallopeptidase [Micromonospora sp. DT31]|uniref:M23 family metallopeptidase n=1 Tax=Micromonospora sp. DT31 TaxID=3393434 RepID=UPI003CF675B6
MSMTFTAARLRVSAVLTVAVVAGALLGVQPAQAARPGFRMPFLCGQTWQGNNWNGHSPAHAIDWNHYSASGGADDLGRRTVASAAGTVLESYYSTTSGYGNTIVIGHGDGWRTRYAHLKSRAVAKGAKVKRGTVIGRVGATSAKYNLSPHLHYEQIHNGRVVVAVVQGVTWSDGRKANQKSTNNC